MCRVLGADGLIYQTVEDLLAAGHDINPNVDRFDAACFDGHYVTGDIDLEFVERVEQGRGSGRVGAVVAMAAGSNSSSSDDGGATAAGGGVTGAAVTKRR